MEIDGCESGWILVDLVVWLDIVCCVLGGGGWCDDVNLGGFLREIIFIYDMFMCWLL